jgi:hypothetical protein
LPRSGSLLPKTANILTPPTTHSLSVNYERFAGDTCRGQEVRPRASLIGGSIPTMKRITMRKELILSLMLLAAPFAVADNAVEVINLKGDDYTVSKALPEEIIGLYKYEGKGEPIVEIRSNGTGLFQPHGVPAIPIKIWINVDENGEPHRQIGTGLRYRYTLLIRYGEGGDGNYPAGGYDLMDVTMLKDQGVAMIYGERTRQL